MKKVLAILLSFFSLVFSLGPVHAAEPTAAEQKPAEPAEKPLEPGWLSLDSSVGAADRWIALNKAAVEGAIGIGISGYLDSSYTWGSRHPKDPSRISGRYFYGDQNKVNWNDFHIALDKPEKDWGVGFHVSGDFGRTGELLREATLWSVNLSKGTVCRVARGLHHLDYSCR